MGVLGRRCGEEHNGGRTTSKVPHGSLPVLRTGQECHHYGGSGLRNHEIYPRLAGQGYCSGDTERPTNLFFSRMFTVLQKNGKR